MAEPLISVIIPIYNVAPYLRQTLGSLAAQQMKELEFVCVDDCSTDDSASIIAEFAAADGRFCPIYFERNMNVSQARKEGVLASHGKYIMFLDGDDYYEPDTCARVYKAMEENGVDVLQFGTNIICHDKALKDNVDALKKTLRPYAHRVEDTPERLLGMVFEKKLWSFNLWNKIYRREVCVKAFSAVEDGVFRNAEDMYAYFLITHFSGSYMGIEGLKCYNYCYGRGLYGHSGMDLKRFEQYCSQMKASAALYRFLDANDLRREYGRIVDDIDQRFINGAVYNWKNTLQPSAQAAGFDVMCETCGAEKVIAAIARNFWFERKAAADAVYGAKTLERRPGRIRTIAMYYHWMTVGGLERVMSTLSYMWTKMGYRIVLITDTEPTENDFPIAPGIKRVVIKDFRTCDAENYIERARELAGALRENEVDLVDYNAWVSPMMLWDLLLIKSMGIAFNYHTHSVITYGLKNADRTLNDRMAACRLMDGIACLSRMDELLLRCANPNTYYIGNPLDCEEIGARPTARLDGHTILWSGRISDEKNPMDVLSMFSDVLEKVPDARLVMLGSGEEKLIGKIKKYIQENGLQDRIEMPGFVSDVAKYYLNAGVLASTSSYEGFPMVFLEACSYGLPIVTYAMDYLEIVRQCGSITSVPQRDAAAMAEAIAGILLDDDYRKRLGAQTRSELMELAGEDIGAKWKKLFESIESGATPEPIDDTQRILVETMLQHYSLGVRKSEQMRAIQRGEGNESGQPWLGRLLLQKPGRWNEIMRVSDESGEKHGYMVLDQQGRGNKLSFRMASRASDDGRPAGYFEAYELPDVDADLDKNRFYKVLTTKNLVETCNSIGVQNLGRAENLENGADLNEMVKPGTYALVNDGKECIIKNCPEGEYKLIVDTVMGTNVRQTLMASGSVRTFVRVRSGSRWSAWKDVYGLDERLNALEGSYIYRLERKARRVVRRLIKLLRREK